MEEAKRLHAQALRRGVRRLQPILLRVLAVGDHRYAALLLDSYPSPSPSAAPIHDRLLHGLASSRSPLLLPSFSRTHRLRLLTHISFTFLLSASAAATFPSFTRFALSSHALLVKSGYYGSGDPFLSSALVSFYARNRLLDQARQVFDEIPHRDTAVCNALLSAYTRGGLLNKAEKLFGEMPERNLVSWTAMVSGYAQNGLHAEAVETFLRMWEGAGLQPNEQTVTSVLPACAAVGAMELGKKVEKYAKKKGHLGMCMSLMQWWRCMPSVETYEDLGRCFRGSAVGKICVLGTQ